MPGREIILGDIRKIIYHLRDDLGFKIKKVTLDGFQSTDTIQQLNKRRFDADYLSVDRNMLPYQDLRDAIYEDRIEFPEYVVPWKHGDTKMVDIAYQELTQLIDTGKKVDHPPGGSKDVADAMAGVCSLLAGDRQFRRGVRSSSDRPRGDLTDKPDQYDPTVIQKQRNDSLGNRQMPSFAPVNMSGQKGLLPGGDIYDGLGIKRSR
jgi:hypothetical protein